MCVATDSEWSQFVGAVLKNDEPGEERVTDLWSRVRVRFFLHPRISFHLKLTHTQSLRRRKSDSILTSRRRYMESNIELPPLNFEWDTITLTNHNHNHNHNNRNNNNSGNGRRPSTVSGTGTGAAGGGFRGVVRSVSRGFLGSSRRRTALGVEGSYHQV